MEMMVGEEPGRVVLVMALFLSEGYFTNVVVPRRLEGAGIADDAYRYGGRALMPHPNVENWIVRQTREWLDRIEYDR
jgi:sirohydrochlorin ferrochelatase